MIWRYGYLLLDSGGLADSPAHTLAHCRAQREKEFYAPSLSKAIGSVNAAIRFIVRSARLQRCSTIGDLEFSFGKAAFKHSSQILTVHARIALYALKRRSEKHNGMLMGAIE